MASNLEYLDKVWEGDKEGKGQEKGLDALAWNLYLLLVVPRGASEAGS